MKVIYLILLLSGMCTSLTAEIRVWTDSDGNQVEGEFDKELFGDILIRDKKGRGHFISIKSLSKKDMEYVQYHVPPQIQTGVTHEMRLLPKVTWSAANDDTYIYDFAVTLEKTSDLPYKGKLSAELFIIGNEEAKAYREHYILMELARSDFFFPEEREENRYEYVVPNIRFNQYVAGWITVPDVRDRGQTYLGYILAVSDSKGRLVNYKTSIRDVGWLTEDMPRTVSELRSLYRNHRGSFQTRHFDDFFSKIDPPRVPWFGNRNDPY